MAKEEWKMKTYRIGNEIQIRWPILTNGQAESLSGRDLRLFLCDQWGNDREVKNFGTEGNVIVFTFYASEQLKTGVYSLTLFENLGKLHQLATDYCYAFRLVSRSNEILDDMSPEELPLDSTNVTVGIHGLSAYEIAVNYGYKGSEEEWAHDFDTVLSSTQIIIEATARSERVLQRAEELMAGLSNLTESEQGRVDAEALRVEHEQERQQNEIERQAAESQRALAETQRGEEFSANEIHRQQVFQTNETLRQNAETQRTAAEAGRVSSENARKEAESQRSLAENARVQNEQERQRAETERMQQENARAEAERLRVTAEQERVNGFAAAQQRLQTAIDDWNRTRKVFQTESEVEIQPNVENIWSEPIAELTITFAEGVEGYANEYMIQFQCPDDAETVLHMPQSVVWMDKEPLDPEAGWMYQISIIDNMAVYAGWDMNV